ncbi:hypothetical protein [Streptomyces sp. NPDC058086]
MTVATVVVGGVAPELHNQFRPDGLVLKLATGAPVGVEAAPVPGRIGVG